MTTIRRFAAFGVAASLCLAGGALAQKKTKLMSAVGKPVKAAFAILGAKVPPKGETYGSDTVFWNSTFTYPGADEGHVQIGTSDTEGKNAKVWKIGLFFKENIGEKRALQIAGFNPKDWSRSSPDEYLSSKKFPKMLLKYNFKPGRFINFETSPTKDLPWGIEVARDPYYK